MRLANLNNVFNKKFSLFDFDDVFFDVMGNPPRQGIWLVYGNEKNGKTWFALLLAKYLAETQVDNVLYISAEEGLGSAFVASIKRAGINTKTKIKFTEYVSADEIRDYLAKRGSAKIVFIDNLTVYSDEINNAEIKALKNDFPNVLFVYLAHEDKKEPYLSNGKLAKKLAEIIIRVVGLKATVSGRCTGGALVVDEEKAALFHGTN